MLLRCGIIQTPGIDYTRSGNIIVFLPDAVPQIGDILTGWVY
jgi:hypothetical protein